MEEIPEITAAHRRRSADDDLLNLTYEQAAEMSDTDLSAIFWTVAGIVYGGTGDWLPANFPRHGMGDLGREQMLSTMRKHARSFFPYGDADGDEPAIMKRSADLTLSREEAEQLPHLDLLRRFRRITAHLVETYGDWLPIRFAKDTASTDREKILYAVSVHSPYFDPKGLIYEPSPEGKEEFRWFMSGGTAI